MSSVVDGVVRPGMVDEVVWARSGGMGDWGQSGLVGPKGSSFIVWQGTFTKVICQTIVELFDF